MKQLLLLPLLVTALIASAQTRILNGKVTGQKDGLPIGNVSISVIGGKSGIAKKDGTFSISVANGMNTIRFKSIGYQEKMVSVGPADNNITIIMEEESKGLNELVVIGYGVQKKSDLTGAVSSVKGSDLTQLPVQRVDQALQGRASGVTVQNTDGAPGGNTTIRIRGGNSITGSNNALVVVDGIQGIDINTINPNDIASLEVLKDASATAIYGARGANGVIMITTKRGATGKPVVNYGFKTGWQHINHKLELMGAGDYARKANDWAITQDGTESTPITPILPFTDDAIAALYANGGTDWQDEIFRTAPLQTHQLSISGGTENARYFISGGYLNQQGIVINSKYARYNLRSNLDLKINKWLSAGVNLNVIKDKGNVPPVGEGTEYVDVLGQVINTVARFDPATPVYDADGNYNYYALKGGPDKTKIYADQDVWNPVATALETVAERNNVTNEIGTFLDFKILDGLTLRVAGAARINHIDEKHYYGTKTQPGKGVNGRGDLTQSKYEYYQNSNILTYDKTFNKKHHLTLTGVAEQQVIQAADLNLIAEQFPDDKTGINDLASAGNFPTKVNTQYKQTLNSFLGRANYVFDGKYMVTASFRADGSSVFGANNKWGYFPSGAVAWRASEEKFIKDLKVFSNLKLRGSWGKTGNQGISPYRSLSVIESNHNYPYDGNGAANTGFLLERPASPNLKWETTAQTDAGIDMGFFNDRLTATVDVYKKLTTDLLLEKQVEGYTGFATVLTNVGSVQNKGLEISLGGTPVAGKNFTWNTGMNISFNRNKVLKLATDEPLAVRTNTGGGYGIFGSGYALKYVEEGQPMDQMRGYVNEGTWTEAEREQAKAMGQAPGEPKWKDVDGDGKITLDGDGHEVIGNAAPDFIYGWNNTLTYKNFELTFLVQGSQGNDIFNAVRIKTETPSNGTGANLKNRWTPDNQHTDVPVFMGTRERSALNLGTDQTVITASDHRSSRWVEDGSYVRLKNITLTYNFSSAVLDRIHINRLSPYIMASNLFTITKYTGYDPEVSSFNGAGGLGIDLSNYPSAKTFMIGVNVGF